MATSGPLPDLNVKYTPAERAKFSSMLDAYFEEKRDILRELFSKLSAPEQIRFREYSADVALIQQRQRELKAQMSQQLETVAKLDSEIDHLKQQRTLNFQHGVKSAVASHTQANLSVVAKSKPKAKKSACRIL